MSQKSAVLRKYFFNLSGRLAVASFDWQANIFALQMLLEILGFRQLTTAVQDFSMGQGNGLDFAKALSDKVIPNFFTIKIIIWINSSGLAGAQGIH